nr:alpha/beta hydrolase [Nostoc sp. CmiVER01]MDZ8121050.1 alpha/beta hydrolase [Nostoc sp. CmiVER01]
MTQSDRAINPELQRFMAKRIGAKTTEVNSSHVPFISHPKEVAKVIEAASTPVKPNPKRSSFSVHTNRTDLIIDSRRSARADSKYRYH